MGLSNQYEGNKFLDNQPFLNQEIADELAHYCPGDSPQSTTLAFVCNLNGSLAQHVKHLLLAAAAFSWLLPIVVPVVFFGEDGLLLRFSLISLAIGSDYSSMANKKRPIHFALAAWLLGSDGLSLSSSFFLQ